MGNIDYHLIHSLVMSHLWFYYEIMKYKALMLEITLKSNINTCNTFKWKRPCEVFSEFLSDFWWFFGMLTLSFFILLNEFPVHDYVKRQNSPVYKVTNSAHYILPIVFGKIILFSKVYL